MTAIRPLRPCAHPGCMELTETGRCERHQRVAFAGLHTREARRKYNERRAPSDGFYGRLAWRKLRASVLARQPLCVECYRLGRVTPATLVDHIIPFRDRPDLGLTRSNLRPLCAACHNRIGAWAAGDGG